MTEHVPAFEGQRPPFQPGNTIGRRLQPGHELSTRHGAYSPRKVDPLAREIVEAILEDPTTPMHVTAAAYRLELWALGRAEARVQLLTEWLDEVAGDRLVAPPGSHRVKAANLELHRAETRAASARSRLGLTPVSAAKLGKNVAQGQVAQADMALRMKAMHDAEQAKAQARAELEAEGWQPPAADHKESL